MQNSTQLPFPYKWQVDRLQLPATVAAADQWPGHAQADKAAAAATVTVEDPQTSGDSAGEPAVAGAACSNTGRQTLTDKASQPGSALQVSTTMADCSSTATSGALQQQVQQQIQLQSERQLPAFFVHPSSGVLRAGEVSEFTLEFTPSCAAEHAASAVLLVERSGDALMTSMGPAAGKSRISTTSGSSTGTANKAPTAAESAAADGPALGGLTASKNHKQLEAATASPGMVVGMQEQEAVEAKSEWEAVLAVGLEGLGVQVRVAVEPSAIVQLPGQLTVGEVGQQALVLRNESAAPAHFSFHTPDNCGSGSSSSSSEASSRKARQKQRVPSAAVSVVPGSGTVPSYGTVNLTLNFTALAAGTHKEVLLCKVLHGPAAQIMAAVSVLEAAVVPAIPLLDFGIMCAGSSSTQQLRLTNTAGSCSTDWQIEQLDLKVNWVTPS